MLGLLPWEKWLPPYVFGPVMCVGSLAVLVFSPELAWWWQVVLVLWAAYCVWGTWMWFRYRRNAFDPSEKDK
jgi:hypothetical protein